MASADDEPDAVAVARETVELAFLAALQVLPPRQRAALILRDVLGMTATETAALLDRFIDAHERGDAAAALAVAAEDIRITMPPYPYLFEGRAAMVPLLERAFGPDRDGDWRLLPTSANRSAAGRGRRDRRDHHVRLRAVPALGLPGTL